MKTERSERKTKIVCRTTLFDILDAERVNSYVVYVCVCAMWWRLLHLHFVEWFISKRTLNFPFVLAISFFFSSLSLLQSVCDISFSLRELLLFLFSFTLILSGLNFFFAGLQMFFPHATQLHKPPTIWILLFEHFWTNKQSNKIIRSLSIL